MRFNRLTANQWRHENVRQHDVDRKHPKYPGVVMFPSSHDITPINLAACMSVLEKLLKVGNEILIVSKPHMDCIEAICGRFADHRDQILFRFTIGACNDSVLSFWEPGAPTFAARVASLRYAYMQGFQTSVSVEPMLDSGNIDRLVAEALPFVTETIWIGKMNHLGRLLKNADAGLRAAFQHVEAGQTDDIILSIYERHKGNPQIRWKESIRKVVGIS